VSSTCTTATPTESPTNEQLTASPAHSRSVTNFYQQITSMQQGRFYGVARARGTAPCESSTPLSSPYKISYKVARLHNRCIHGVASQQCVMLSGILALSPNTDVATGHPKLLQLETPLPYRIEDNVGIIVRLCPPFRGFVTMTADSLNELWVLDLRGITGRHHWWKEQWVTWSDSGSAYTSGVRIWDLFQPPTTPACCHLICQIESRILWMCYTL